MSDDMQDAESVAIVGLAGRFPGARDATEFWRNLCAGVESVATFSDEELLAAGIPAEQLRDPAYVRARAVLQDPDLFDAEFFGFNPREAELTDPQQRVFLECAWHALEDAGCDLDSAVFPGSQGGPLMHVIAAKAVAFGEALQPEFKSYSARVIENSKTLAQALTESEYQIVSGGTDNHLMLIDLRNKKLNGKIAENALSAAEITVNKNMVPFDTESPFVTSGIRIGTAALTSRGFGKSEMLRIAGWIDRVLRQPENTTEIEKVKNEVHDLMKSFPLNYLTHA